MTTTTRPTRLRSSRGAQWSSRRRSAEPTRARSSWNNFTLDGVANTDPNYNTYVVQPSVDMLQEFKVQSGVYPAEFGRAASQIDDDAAPAAPARAPAKAGGKPSRPIMKGLSDVTGRLAWMSKRGIDRQVVGGWPDWFGYELPAAEGEAWCRLFNDAQLAAAKADPRFVLQDEFHLGAYDYLTRVVYPLIVGPDNVAHNSVFAERCHRLASAFNPDSLGHLSRIRGFVLRRRPDTIGADGLSE